MAGDAARRVPLPQGGQVMSLAQALEEEGEEEVVEDPYGEEDYYNTP